jgi:hygromycin-B 7''-O-kinase
MTGEPVTLSLPDLSSFDAYKAWRADRSRWLPAALDIAHGHGLKTAAPHVFTTGTNLVIGLGDELILKIFPPIFRDKFVSERISLAQLQGRLSIPIPDILFEGERDGWPYLVITRLHGTVGSEVWPALPEDQKERVLGQIGATIAEVQRAPPGELSNMEPGWPQFISRQIEGCRARHTRLGLPAKFLDGFDDILRDAATLIPLDSAVILTGEYIPENFLLSRDGNGWRVAGLFDFGDVMTGFCEYDLLGPSAFMTAGIKRRVRSLFEGFGYSDADINPIMKRRLMALTLLHRVSDPIRHIQIEGWQEKARDLVELQDLLWPV